MTKKTKSKARRRSRNNIPPIAILAGVAASASQMWKAYKYDNKSMPSGQAFVSATTGYNPVKKQIIPLRLVEVYGPAGAGIAIHEIFGNSRGALNSGIGCKLNNKMGKIKI